MPTFCIRYGPPLGGKSKFCQKCEPRRRSIAPLQARSRIAWGMATWLRAGSPNHLASAIQAMVGMADSRLSVVQGGTALTLDRSRVTGQKPRNRVRQDDISRTVARLSKGQTK
jgi:hypothetical protein